MGGNFPFGPSTQIVAKSIEYRFGMEKFIIYLSSVTFILILSARQDRDLAKCYFSTYTTGEMYENEAQKF